MLLDNVNLYISIKSCICIYKKNKLQKYITDGDGLNTKFRK
jgi:hypothetical protein